MVSAVGVVDSARMRAGNETFSLLPGVDEGVQAMSYANLVVAVLGLVTSMVNFLAAWARYRESRRSLIAVEGTASSGPQPASVAGEKPVFSPKPNIGRASKRMLLGAVLLIATIVFAAWFRVWDCSGSETCGSFVVERHKSLVKGNGIPNSTRQLALLRNGFRVDGQARIQFVIRIDQGTPDAQVTASLFVNGTALARGQGYRYSDPTTCDAVACTITLSNSFTVPSSGQVRVEYEITTQNQGAQHPPANISAVVDICDASVYGICPP